MTQTRQCFEENAMGWSRRRSTSVSHLSSSLARRRVSRDSGVRAALAAALVGTLAGPLVAASAEPHEPKEELASFKMREGFDANLFAAEPMISNPIHMTWDPQGRLWVVTSTAYPHLKPGQTTDDKIVILEDTDGDGRADESTVFADGLYIPTGLALGDGGVYVANQTELLFLKDTNGDDKADVRRTMLTGFGMADSHHAMSAWTWGPGGWLYFQEGTFMHTNVETPNGVVRLVNGGVYQYRPRRQRLRVHADYAASNPWGHGFDRWGQEILIDNPRMFFLSPMTADNRTKIGYDPANRANTKLCGGSFVSGRHLPERYRGELWSNKYKSHDIARYEIVDDGAGFDYKAKPPVLQSDDKHFRPVDLEVGPRGAVYVLDWCDALIGHMQHSMRDPRRDDRHGRIWRITHEDRPLVDKPKLTGVPLQKLLNHLKAPEDWTRYQVKRVLYDTNPERAAKALEQWVASLDPSKAGFEHHRLEALWAYQTIGVVNEALLDKVLGSDDPRARAAAVRVVRYWHDRISSPLRRLADAVRDKHPRVRMEAVLSASFIKKPEALKVALHALDKPTDRHIKHALKRAVDGLQKQWLPAYRSGALTFDKAAHRRFALANVRSSAVVDAIVNMLVSGAVEPAQLEAPLDALASEATAKQLEPLLKLLRQQLRGDAWGTETLPYASLAKILDALADAAAQRDVVSGKIRNLVRRTRGIDHPDVRLAWARLAGATETKRASGRLRRIAKDGQASGTLRRTAAEALGSIGGEKNLRLLRKLASNKRLRHAAVGVAGLAAHDVAKAADAAAAALGRPPAQAEAVHAILRPFLERKGGVAALAKALEQTTVDSDAAKEAVGYLNRIGVADEALLSALRPATRAASLVERLQKEDRKKLLADIKRDGRPARGQRLFRRPSLACATCHGLAGAGPRIGPDLATVGASSPLSYLVDSVLRPNKIIKEGFQSVTVVTQAGRVHTGVLRNETKDRLVIAKATQSGRTVEVDKERVAQRTQAPSLMPPGLMNQLDGRQAFLDLLAYLRALGRSGRYQPTTEPVLRSWKLASVDRPAASVDPTQLGADTGWRRTFTTADGSLPRWLYARNDATTVIARSRLERNAPGDVRLVLNDAKGVAGVWVGGERRKAKRRQEVTLTAGDHTVTVVVDVDTRGEKPLRVTAEDASSSGP